MTIQLDFDGTVVEHQYPLIGAYNNGCIEVLEKLRDSGHLIVLNTFRANISKEAKSVIEQRKLQDAVDYMQDDLVIAPDFINEYKKEPRKWNMKSFIKEGEIYIDDIGEGHPLHANGMVDWQKVDEEFTKYGIYEKKT